MNDPADPLNDWRRRIAGVGAPLYLGAGTAGPVLAAPEQAVLVLGPPRAGKTSSLVIPNVLSAPGPVVSTSTKTDVLVATWRRRCAAGRCWLFDPTGAIDPPVGVMALHWSPVQASSDWDGALLMARSLALAARPGGQVGEAGHWTERAEALLAPLLHAAALGGRDMHQVLRWVLRQDLDSGIAALGAAGADLAADVLGGLAATDDRERSGIWSTAAGILAAYRSRAALDAAAAPNFDADAFAGSGDTVYVCSPARHQHLVAPVVVALVEQIRSAAYDRTTANARAGWRAGPPIVLALDEVANIAPLPDLPALVAEGGSQGLLTLACLQDLSQARVRWGEAAEGFLSLFGAKVVLPGIGDRRTLELVSSLAGQHEVAVRSVSRRPWWAGRQGGASVTWSTRRQPRLPVDAVAQLPAGRALLVAGAQPPCRLRLTPWFSTEPFSTEPFSTEPFSTEPLRTEAFATPSRVAPRPAHPDRGRGVETGR